MIGALIRTWSTFDSQVQAGDPHIFLQTSYFSLRRYNIGEKKCAFAQAFLLISPLTRVALQKTLGAVLGYLPCGVSCVPHLTQAMELWSKGSRKKKKERGGSKVGRRDRSHRTHLLDTEWEQNLHFGSISDIKKLHDRTAKTHRTWKWGEREMALSTTAFRLT